MSLLLQRRDYGATHLRADVLAGLTVAVMFVPQAMAYGLLAGLDPVAGLYTAAIPVLVYSLVGASRHMAVGPVALVALLVAGGLGQVAEPHTPEAARAAVLLAGMCGLGWILLGVLRAGFLVNFISHPVVLGFNAAAAILTAASQLGPLLGIPKHVAPHAGPQNPWPWLLHLEQAHAWTVALGLGATATLLVLRRATPRVPGPLLVCLLGAGIVHTLGLDARGVAVVGDIPRGLPPWSPPDLDPGLAGRLLPTAISVIIVGYASSISVVKALAAREREVVHPNHELVALGVANVCGACFGAFPATAGLSRSAVLAQAGSRSQAAMLVSGLVVTGTLAWLGPWFHQLPLSVLAAIIILAAVQLVELAGARAVLQAKPMDAGILALCFATTLTLGLGWGLAIGLGSSLGLLVARTAVPHSAELGRIPGTLVYRNAQRYHVEICPQVGILRIDAPLYFANAAYLADRVARLVAERPALRIVALDLSAVADVDATAVEALRRVAADLRARGDELHLVGAIGPVRDVLAGSGLIRELGAHGRHRTILEAAPLWMERISRDYCCRQCSAAAFPNCTLLPRARPGSDDATAARFTPQI
jgi:SulP family sulfate permease